MLKLYDISLHVFPSTRRPSGSDRQAEKPLTPSDYQLIEEQLLRRNLAARDLLTTQALRAQGWSSHQPGKVLPSAG